MKIEDKIEVEHISNNKPYGDDICLKYKTNHLLSLTNRVGIEILLSNI